MENSKNYVLRLVPATPQEVLLDKLEVLKWQIRAGIVAIIIVAVFSGVYIKVMCNTSRNSAVLSADLANEKYAQSLDIDSYITINDQLSIQLAVRRAGEEEWHPRAAVASWHEEIEVRVLAKVVLPAEYRSYNHPMNLGTSNGLADTWCSEGVTITETHESEKVTYVQETIFRGRVTAGDWWEGYAPIAIRYWSDDLAEKLAVVYVIPDFAYISKANIIVMLVGFMGTFGITVSGVISRRKTLRKLRSLK